MQNRFEKNLRLIRRESDSNLIRIRFKSILNLSQNRIEFRMDLRQKPATAGDWGAYSQAAHAGKLPEKFIQASCLKISEEFISIESFDERKFLQASCLNTYMQAA